MQETALTRHPNALPNDQTAPSNRSIVLVGLMGVGKTTIGRRLAHQLGLDFVDADEEIEKAAGCSIADIFERFGEYGFRDGERRVMHRLMAGARQVIATGGGAFVDAATRALILAEGLAVWLDADIDILVDRTAKRNTRPLLQTGDPREVLMRLAEARKPFYQQAHIHISSNRSPHDVTVQSILGALKDRMTIQPPVTNGNSNAPVEIPVNIAGKPYTVEIGAGLLATAGIRLRPYLKSRTVIVTDNSVAGLYLVNLDRQLKEQGVDVSHIILPAGEAAKNFTELSAILSHLVDRGIDRADAIIALGGGVVGDITGFAASILRRGCRFIQIPTTLLAQVDSSVGGKTAINLPQGKNLVGSFHQPCFVLADTAVLDTLPRRQLLAGYAEIVKYGLINDAAFFDWLEANGQAVLASNSTERTYAIEMSVRAKAAIVAKDETESSGVRELLNLGHTFGHALEAATGFSDALLHGEAVAIGIVLAFDYSCELGLCPAADAVRVRHHFKSVGLRTSLIPWLATSGEALVQYMMQDKKIRSGALPFLLAHGIGQTYLEHTVDLAHVTHFLDKALAS